MAVKEWNDDIIFLKKVVAGGASRSYGIQVARERYSSLSPGKPLLTQQEIAHLFDRSNAVLQHFAPLYGKSPDAMALDMEIKWLEPDRRLIIKQVRPYASGGTK
jgi:hypothetical protein